MSQTREGRREQGQREGVYSVTKSVASILADVGEEEGLCPTLIGVRVVARERAEVHAAFREHFLVTVEDMAEFLRHTCPRLQQRRDLREQRLRLMEERIRLLEQLRDARRDVAEAQQELLEARAEKERLLVLNAGLRQDIVEAQQGENEARVESSSALKKLEETSDAYEEAKRHFISAPDLVSSLQSLADEVKTMQDIQRRSEKTAEAMAERPTERRRSQKTLTQMKRVLHDIQRWPRRRRRKVTDATEDGEETFKRGRICYTCRCKGHLAKDCLQARASGTAEVSESRVSETPAGSESAGAPQDLNSEAAYPGLNILSAFLRRTFTSGD